MQSGKPAKNCTRVLTKESCAHGPSAVFMRTFWRTFCRTFWRTFIRTFASGTSWKLSWLSSLHAHPILAASCLFPTRVYHLHAVQPRPLPAFAFSSIHPYTPVFLVLTAAAFQACPPFAPFPNKIGKEEQKGEDKQG